MVPPLASVAVPVDEPKLIPAPVIHVHQVDIAIELRIDPGLVPARIDPLAFSAGLVINGNVTVEDIPGAAIGDLHVLGGTEVAAKHRCRLPYIRVAIAHEEISGTGIGDRESSAKGIVA